MNVERLLSMLYIIDNEITEKGTPNLLSQLGSTIHQKISSPSAETDKLFKDALTNLQLTLLKSETNELTPSQSIIFSEINAASKVGKGLAERVNSILTENTLTINLAQQEIQKLSSKVDSFGKQVHSTILGLEKMNLMADDLNKGESEVSIVFPMESSETSLDYLKAELDDLDKAFRVIAEVVEGDTSSLKLRTIGSSSILIALSCSLPLAWTMSKIIKELVLIYKHILEIRIKKEELNMITGKNKEDLDKILDISQKEQLEKGLQNLVKDLMKEYKGTDKGRKKELEGFLQNSLEKLARKFDNGFGFEVDTAEPPKPEEDEEGNVVSKEAEEYQLAIKKRQEIQGTNELVKSLERHSGPILALGSEETPDGEEEEA